MSQTVDGEVVMLSAHWEKRRAAVVELQEQLQQIPGFLTDLETCTNRIGESLCLSLVFTLLLKCVLAHSFSHGFYNGGNSPDNAYTKCTLGGGKRVEIQDVAYVSDCTRKPLGPVNSGSYYSGEKCHNY
jgi:hypothetical protein